MVDEMVDGMGWDEMLGSRKLGIPTRDGACMHVLYVCMHTVQYGTVRMS